MYDCIIVGGGIAGLQAAIQLGRYQHDVVVIDSHVSRSLICQNYHNILGWPDGISGPHLRNLGKIQCERLGVEFVLDEIHSVQRQGEWFQCVGIDDVVYEGKRLLLATGLMDRIPDIAGLPPCLGTSVYVCPDCDGYEIRDRRTIVIGAGRVGAEMAFTLSYWTNDLIYVNHERTPVEEDVLARLRAKDIDYYLETVECVTSDAGQITGVTLGNGQRIDVERGFVAFGGNEVKSGLAQQLGVRLQKNKHVETDSRTKETNVLHVWAAGDVAAHSEQAAIAMGEGSQAAIWIHKSLMPPPLHAN